jgi:hypothetical protein
VDPARSSVSGRAPRERERLGGEDRGRAAASRSAASKRARCAACTRARSRGCADRWSRRRRRRPGGRAAASRAVCRPQPRAASRAIPHVERGAPGKGGFDQIERGSPRAR